MSLRKKNVKTRRIRWGFILLPCKGLMEMNEHHPSKIGFLFVTEHKPNSLSPDEK